MPQTQLEDSMKNPNTGTIPIREPVTPKEKTLIASYKTLVAGTYLPKSRENNTQYSKKKSKLKTGFYSG